MPPARRHKLWKAEKDMAARRCDPASKFTEELDPSSRGRPEQAKATGPRRRASTPHPEVEYEITPDEWEAKTSGRISAPALGEVHQIQEFLKQVAYAQRRARCSIVIKRDSH
jgi:hypothetical protein